jgi:hypothetical protein
MPMNKTTVTAGGTGYATVGLFVGPVDHTEAIPVTVADVSSLVDDNNFLIPGTPLTADGEPIDDGDAVYGVVMEPVKAAGTSLHVTVARIGLVNRDIVEDNLGRALTADELAGFDDAACLLTLTRTA